MESDRNGYQRMWSSEIGDSRPTQLRFGLTTHDGRPVKFLVQLEYEHDDGYRPVARFDHERGGPPYRDVRLRGLHLDVYDPNGEQRFKRTDFEPINERDAVPAAESYLRAHYERLINRYEGWI